jgi:hypothetical protein
MRARSSKLATGISIAALAAALTVTVPLAFPSLNGSVALAQQGGGGGGGGNGSGGGGGGSGGGGGGGGSGSGGGGNSGGGAGSGQGGPSDDSDGKGPRAGSSGGSQGGTPVWSHDNPVFADVELGRMNVARSPDRILLHAVEEEVSTLTDGEIAFYSMTFDDIVNALKTDFDAVEMIDSPLANLGLLMDVLGTEVYEQSELEAAGVVDPEEPDRTLEEKLAAVFLGTASDKNLEVTESVTDAVATILGYDLTDDQIEKLAADAEEIRSAILEGHG